MEKFLSFWGWTFFVKQETADEDKEMLKGISIGKKGSSSIAILFSNSFRFKSQFI